MTTEMKPITHPEPALSDEQDLLQTIREAHALLQSLLARRGGRMPHHTYMAMCYLQVDLTASCKPQSFDRLTSGGNHAKAV